MSGPTEVVTCPRCGTSLSELKAAAASDVGTEQIRTPVECPACEASLVIIAKLALPDALGVDVWVEDRREEDG